MAPLTVCVQGKSTIHRVAEQGLLSLLIKSKGLHLQTVSNDVSVTLSCLKNLFKKMQCPNDGIAGGIEWVDAQVVGFSVSLNQVSSHQSYNDKTKQLLPRRYTICNSVKAKFRDLQKLTTFVVNMLKTPHVKLQSIQWELTEETCDKLASELRKQAMQNALNKARDYASIIDREVVPVKITASNRNDVDWTAVAKKKTVFRLAVPRVPDGANAVIDDVSSLEPQEITLVETVEVELAAID